MKIKKQMIRIRKIFFYLKKEFKDQTTNFLAARYRDIVGAAGIFLKAVRTEHPCS
jgi:hypothetical protein